MTPCVWAGRAVCPMAPWRSEDASPGRCRAWVRRRARWMKPGSARPATGYSNRAGPQTEPEAGRGGCRNSKRSLGLRWDWTLIRRPRMRAPIRPAINVPALFRLERRRSWPACCSAASNSRPDQADPKALGEARKLLRLPGRMNLAISVYYESHGRPPIVESVCRLHVKKTASDPVTSAAS